jgi:sigma-B regulation protein RsbU (phosphoserine phosphatase)
MGGRIFHQTHWAPLLQMQGSVAEIKLDVVHRDGRTLPMVMNVVRRHHAGGTFDEISTFLAEDRDKYEKELLRARRHAEELLQRQQEVQDALTRSQAELDRQRASAEGRAQFAEQMVGIVSHDLRNPPVGDPAERLRAGPRGAARAAAQGARPDHRARPSGRSA